MIGGLEVMSGKEEQKRDEWEMGLGAAAAKAGWAAEEAAGAWRR